MIPAEFLIGQRFYLMLYAFYRLIRFTATIDAPFADRLAERDFSFVMSSKEGKAERYYQVRGGKLTSRTTYQPTDFGLIWLDEKTGYRVMMDMVKGKRNALKNAVIKGELLLEGEAALVGHFLEIINHLARVYRKKKKQKKKRD